MRRGRLSLRLLAIGALLCAGCLSPTLPLPPPDEPDSIHMGTCDADGICTWKIGGTCDPGSRVTVFNETSGFGVVFEDRSDSGRYVVDLQAVRCDVGSVSIQRNEDTSSATRFVIQETGLGSNPDAGACK